VKGVREAVARATKAVRTVASDVRAESIQQAAGRLDARRRDLLGAEAKLLLLKASGGAQRFEQLEEMTDSWDARLTEFGSTTFQVAKSDADFNANAWEVSHIIIVGSTNEAVNNRLFEVNRDTTVPAGLKAVWQFGGRFTGKRYVPPA
jgi:hypothetical protein